MDFAYYVLTLPETVGTYLGLVLQMALRQDVLRHGVAGVVALNVYSLILGRDQESEHPFRPVLTYVLTALVLTGLFWPDVTPYGRQAWRMLAPEQIASKAATNDPEAELLTAADVRDTSYGLLDDVVAPVRDTPSALEPIGMRFLLGIATETPLRIARLLNAQAYRPGSQLVPMEWLMGMEMPGDISRALADWIEGCYKPSMLTDKEFTEAITAQDFLPWGNTPVAQALATRQVTPGAQTGKGGYFRRTTPLGVMFLSNPDSPTTVPCGAYLNAVELEVQRWLYTTPSSGGTPLSQIFEQELGLTIEQQGRLVVHHAMMTLLHTVPATSLAGTYATLAGINTALGTARGALGGASAGTGGTRPGAGLGAIVGGASAVVGQVEYMVQRLLWWVGIATWLVNWLPDIMGTIQLMLLGFFPVVFLLMLWRGQWIKMLLEYLLTLTWAYSLPLWFALTDLLARGAASRASQSQDAILQLLNWVPAQLDSVQMTMIALAVLPILEAAVLFKVSRIAQGLLGKVV